MEFKLFEDLIIDEWTWRKTEISTLILLAEEKKEEVVLKSIILLLYAHWEGYIKKCGKIYLKYISDRNYQLSLLTDNFRAVRLKGVTKACLLAGNSLALENEVTFITQYTKIDSHNFEVTIDLEDDKNSSIIDTNQNLTPTVFKNILNVLGLTYKSQIEVKEKYIDTNLLATRNAIGHGNKFKKTIENDFNLEIENIKKLRDVIVSIIENFRDELLEYSRKEFYLKTNQDQLMNFLQEKDVELEKIFNEIDSRYKEDE